MRVDHFLPNFVMHDAIGNHVLQLRGALRSAGLASDIYADVIDSRLASEAMPFRTYDPALSEERVLLYQLSTHSDMSAWLSERREPVLANYHNITPSEYFARWEPEAARSMDQARQELRQLSGVVEFAIAVSAFNEKELLATGYRSTAVSPLLVDFEQYHQPPDPKTLQHLFQERLRGGHRWLFVGRIAPNKCQHDIIAAFALYRKIFDRNARLTLIGGSTSPRYRQALERMSSALDLADAVEILEGLPFQALLAYYASADVLVSMSEHEGFCVPILEAMELGLPVVAFDAAAVAETVADAAVLLQEKDPLTVACRVSELLADPSLRDRLINAGRARAAEFALARTSAQFIGAMSQWAEQHGAKAS